MVRECNTLEMPAPGGLKRGKFDVTIIDRRPKGQLYAF